MTPSAVSKGFAAHTSAAAPATCGPSTTFRCRRHTAGLSCELTRGTRGGCDAGRRADTRTPGAASDTYWPAWRNGARLPVVVVAPTASPLRADECGRVGGDVAALAAVPRLATEQHAVGDRIVDRIVLDLDVPARRCSGDDLRAVATARRCRPPRRHVEAFVCAVCLHDHQLGVAAETTQVNPLVTEPAAVTRERAVSCASETVFVPVTAL